MRDDLELLRSWRRGDVASGRELFERHFDAMLRFFRNKAGDDVEDLVQASFAACLAAEADFRGEASFRTYLFTIARHELYAYWRKRKRASEELDIGSVSVEDLGLSPSGILAARHERALLARALRSIPMELQIALELHYWEELTGPELALVLEVPEGTVRSRLRRGRELLRDKLAALAGTEAESERSSFEDIDRWAASLKDAMGR